MPKLLLALALLLSGTVCAQVKNSLAPEDQKILQQGPVGDSQHAAGVFFSIIPGLGVGQAVQGRYRDTGWIFTVGESASLLLVGVTALGDITCEGRSSCSGDNIGLIVTGLVVFGIFKIWDIVDAAVGPTLHNERYQQLSSPRRKTETSFYLVPTDQMDGAVLGFGLRI